MVGLLAGAGSPRVVVALHTHGHWDHIGAAAAIRERTGCLVAVHKDDADMVASHAENDRRFLRAFDAFPPDDASWHEVYDNLGAETPVDIRLSGGEVFDLGKDVLLEVVPMPGHTAGCVGILEKNRGILFTGDSLCGPGVFGTLAQYEFADIYRATIRRIMDPGVNEIHTGHLDPIKGDEVRPFLQACLDEVDRIERCVRETEPLHLSLLEQTIEVCRRLDKPMILQPLFTVSAHKMKKEQEQGESCQEASTA
jgi:glyoxylase-like metal-dependent hydrolase (beta-lactamase superfamily II)